MRRPVAVKGRVAGFDWLSPGRRTTVPMVALEERRPGFHPHSARRPLQERGACWGPVFSVLLSRSRPVGRESLPHPRGLPALRSRRDAVSTFPSCLSLAAEIPFPFLNRKLFGRATPVRASAQELILGRRGRGDGGRRLAVEERPPALLFQPHRMQHHRQLARHRHHRPSLGPLAAPRRQRQAPSPQRRILPKRP